MEKFEQSMRKIPITIPFIDEQDIKSIDEVLRSRWIVQGPKTKEFEDSFRNFTNSKYAVAVSSCTTALHLSLEALEIVNSKVIVPAFTFVATANAVEYTNSKVIFCDVKLDTYNIDETKIVDILEREKEIKAVIPVNLFGLCANLPEIVKISNSYNIKVIEDCACSFGAYIDGVHSGNFGDCGCFSFHPRKAITTGEGGMIITNNEDLYRLVLSLRNHGASISDYQRHNSQYSFLLPEYDVKGYNYRITDIQAALGISQLKKADYILQKRRTIASKYEKFFKENYYKGKSLDKFFRLPHINQNYIHGYQSFVTLFTLDDSLFDDKLKDEQRGDIIDRWNYKRNELMFELEKVGISTRQGTQAVHILGYYRRKYNLKPYDFINSYAADKLSISWPIYPEMDDQDLLFIFDQILINLKKIL